MKSRTSKITKEKVRWKYWDESKSLNEIADDFGVGSTTIWKRMKEWDIPRRSEGRRALQVDLENYSALSYILGVLEGDGYVVKRDKGRYRINLKVRDESFAEKFAKYLRKIGLNAKVKIRVTDTEVSGRVYKDVKYFITNAYSKTLYEWYINLTEEEFQSIVFKYPWGFVEGFYEADGSLGKDPLKIQFGNTNPKLIDLIEEILEGEGFNPTNYCDKRKNKKDLYYVYLQIQEEAKDFLNHINSCIRRKSKEVI